RVEVPCLRLHRVRTRHIVLYLPSYKNCFASIVFRPKHTRAGQRYVGVPTQSTHMLGKKIFLENHKKKIKKDSKMLKTTF
mgnify:CR=1